MKTMLKYRIVMVAWVLLLLASCSVQQETVAPQPRIRATVTLAPGTDETALYALTGTVGPVRIHSYPSVFAAAPLRVSLDFRTEQELQLFTKRLQEQVLPVLAMHTEKLGL